MVVLWSIAAAMVRLPDAWDAACDAPCCAYMLQSPATRPSCRCLLFLSMCCMAQVPLMSRNNDTARSIHIGSNALNVALFLWQVRHAKCIDSVRRPLKPYQACVGISGCANATHQLLY